MGERGSWFGALKKVFSPEPKDKKKTKKNKNEKIGGKSKRRWGFGKSKEKSEPTDQISAAKIKAAEVDSDGAYSLAAAAAAAAVVAAEAAAEAAAEVVRLTSAQSLGRSKEEISAIKIQTIFRGFLARRALRGLKGLARMKALMSSGGVKRQTAATLRSMRILCRVQTQIRTRRIRMLELNQSLHRPLRPDHGLDSLRSSIGEEWDDRVQTKEQIAASILGRREAALRRERALAYAFSHQGKGITRAANPTFTDPANPQWGWSWAERWATPRTWDWRRRGPCASVADDDARSLASAQSERGRWLSAASSMRDDESLTSSPAVPSYMASTESTRARSRLNSPELNSTARKRLSFHATAAERSDTGFPVTPRRHSGPPRVEMATPRSILGR